MLHCAMVAISVVRSDQIAFCLKRFTNATMAVILDIGTERFSNSESQCHPDASHQVQAQSELLFWRRCGLKNIKMVTMAAILDIGTERF